VAGEQGEVDALEAVRGPPLVPREGTPRDRRSAWRIGQAHRNGARVSGRRVGADHRRSHAISVKSDQFVELIIADQTIREYLGPHGCPRRPNYQVEGRLDPLWITTDQDTLVLKGYSRSSLPVVAVTWESSTGQRGQAEGTLRWVSGELRLQPGDNHIVVTAETVDRQRASERLSVVYNPGIRFGGPLELTAEEEGLCASIFVEPSLDVDREDIRLVAVDADGRPGATVVRLQPARCQVNRPLDPTDVRYLRARFDHQHDCPYDDQDELPPKPRDGTEGDYCVPPVQSRPVPWPKDFVYRGCFYQSRRNQETLRLRVLVGSIDPERTPGAQSEIVTQRIAEKMPEETSESGKAALNELFSRFRSIEEREGEAVAMRWTVAWARHLPGTRLVSGIVSASNVRLKYRSRDCANGEIHFRIQDSETLDSLAREPLQGFHRVFENSETPFTF
jgi:hypothetical protein